MGFDNLVQQTRRFPLQSLFSFTTCLHRVKYCVRSNSLKRKRIKMREDLATSHHIRAVSVVQTVIAGENLECLEAMFCLF